jgi:preprotein translocase subunit YajC
MNFFISDALAQTGGPAANQWGGIIWIVAMIGIFYFLLIRPQAKRAKEHKALFAALAKGDEILTQGGLLGRVTEVGEQYATVELAEGVEVKLQKGAVSSVLPKGTLKQASK